MTYQDNPAYQRKVSEVNQQFDIIDDFLKSDFNTLFRKWAHEVAEDRTNNMLRQLQEREYFDGLNDDI